MNSSPTFRLKLFGSPSLEGDGGTLVTGRAAQRHRLALLALLALAPSQRLSRDKLLAYLWPESDPERGRNLLKVSTYVIRTALGESALLTVGDELRLNPEVIRVDVAEFEAALQQADHARALSLYRGPFLDGFFLSEAPGFERWVDGERERLAGGYTKALEGLAEAAEAGGDFARAVECWRARAAHDPYDSRVALRLMQTLEATGNRAGALQHATVHQRLLREEFGVGMPPDVLALTERLRGEPVVKVESSLEPEAGAPEVRQVVFLPALGAEAEVSALADALPAFSTVPAQAGPGEGGRVRRRRWLGAAALLAILSLVGGIWAVWPRGSEPERSIVVLPFLNLSPEDDNDYFSDGLTEEIISRLAGVAQLKVISRTSAMYYKGSKKPLPQIADELDVAHVLEGSVRQSEGRLRITAQLIDARTDEHLWTENYDYRVQDVFRVQEEIARQVVRALEVELGAGESMQLARQGTHNPEAYDLYRRGRFFWSTRTREGHEKAIAYYRLAIERDPTYADPYSGLADVWLTAYQFGVFDLSEAELRSRHRWAAERALALDDRSASAHASFAVSLWWQRDWPGAERELRRALELNSGHGPHGWLSLLLSGTGRLEEALRLGRRSVERDPFTPVTIDNYAWHCYIARDYDCVIEQTRRALRIDPSFAQAYQRLGLAYARKGMIGEALPALHRGAELRPAFLADLAYGLALAGRRQEALETLDRAKANEFEPFFVARAYIALEEPDSAFAWLGRARWQWPHRANRFDPALDPLRSDPRFAELSVRIEREMGMR